MKTIQTREQRAREKFHGLRFQAANIRLKDRAGEERLLGVVYVTSPSGNTYTVTCGAETRPVHCSCPDCCRPWEQDPEKRGTTCYHMIAAAMWLSGDVPELPKPAFDIDGEGELLAKLEESERIERARREAEVLWG